MQMLKEKKAAAAMEKAKNYNHVRSLEIIDDDSTEEILKRFPIKKVFECISLSKHWQSSILSPAFTKIYLHQHPCYLLLMNDLDKCFYYSPLVPSGDMNNSAEEFVNSFGVVVNGDELTTVVTQPVQGFFCVYNYLEMQCLYIYHVWRGAIMKITYPLIRGRSNNLDFFFLGFEPVNGVYKLLKITPVTKYPLDSTCFDVQILTMDCKNNKKSKLLWRKLPKNILAPLYYSPNDSGIVMCLLGRLLFSVDGFLFWRSIIHGLICFDLKEEKFLVVKPPPDLNQQDFRDCLMTQFRGQLALFMHNPDVDKNLILCTLTIQQVDDNQAAGYTYAWTKHSIRLLSEGMNDRYFPIGNLPTGELLLSNLDTKDPFTIVYAYNHDTHLFQRFITGKLKMDIEKMKAQPKELVKSVCCVQPSFTTPDAFGCKLQQ